jgi:lactoylglutathione lyase
MKGITSIGHVAIRVKEFERSLAFDVGKLGFSEMFRLDRDGLWIIDLRDGRSVPRAVFRCHWRSGGRD